MQRFVLEQKLSNISNSSLKGPHHPLTDTFSVNFVVLRIVFLQHGHDFLLPNTVVNFDCGAVKTTGVGEKSPTFISSCSAWLVINTRVVRQRARGGGGKAAPVEGDSQSSCCLISFDTGARLAKPRA